MSTNGEAKKAQAASLTGAEKVAVLLLALGKALAARLLKRFDPEELKLLTRSVTELPAISIGELDILVEEFAKGFSTGVKFAGTATEIRELLTSVMNEEELARAISDDPPTDDDLWVSVSKARVEVLRAFLMNEHPQTTALILSRIEPEIAAKTISSFPPEVRAGLLCRMLGIKKVADDALRVVEITLKERLIATTSSASHAGIADILNRLDKSQSDAVLKSLAEVRPDDAKALKNLLFTFEELVGLSPQARTLVLDQVPIERLVLALRGTDAEFQAAILSALASRSRRMVEAELQGGNTASPRDVAEARRGIVDVVLKMAAKGEIVIKPADDLQDITA
jgi:flagellar motor switch protein FliG